MSPPVITTQLMLQQLNEPARLAGIRVTEADFVRRMAQRCAKRPNASPDAVLSIGQRRMLRAVWSRYA
jgi:hypothetical protein